ncbi:MAG: dynamin family protein [Cyanobacteriota bacterium]
MENIEILKDFNNNVSFLTLKANEISNIISSLFPDDKDLFLIKDNIDKLNANIFRIIVVGEFKRGKSTFINSLLGEKILPMGITPTTAAVNVIRYGETPKGILKYKDGTSKEITIEELNFFATTKNNDFEKLELIEVYYPSSICKEKVEIIDSPGVNDIDEQRVEITYNYIPKCDAGIFLLSATQQLSSSERDFITSRINKHLNKMFFILNKIDQLNESELEEAIDYVKSELKNVSDNNKIFPVSSKIALKGVLNSSIEEINNSKIEVFQKELFTFLLEEKGSFLIKNTIAKLISSTNKTVSNLNMMLTALDQSIEDFNANVEKSKFEFEEINKEKILIDEFITNKKDKVINTIIEDLNYSFQSFLTKIDTKIKEILDLSIEEIKKEMTSYLKTLIEEWTKKIDEFVKLEIDELDNFIKEKTGKIYESLDNIQANFLASNNIVVEFKNTNNLANDILKNIPEFLLDQKDTKSKVARGIFFTLGAVVLTGGAIIPAMILGGVATFLSDIFLKSWKEEKIQNQIFTSVKESLESNTPIFREQIKNSLNEFFELEIRKKVIDELDSSIDSLKNTIDLLAINKNTKEEETTKHKEEYKISIDKILDIQKEILSINV